MMPFLVSFWDSTIQIWDNFKVWMGEFFDSISSVWNTFRPWDIVDVILVAYLVYLGIKPGSGNSGRSACKRADFTGCVLCFGECFAVVYIGVYYTKGF